MHRRIPAGAGVPALRRHRRAVGGSGAGGDVSAQAGSGGVDTRRLMAYVSAYAIS